MQKIISDSNQQNLKIENNEHIDIKDDNLLIQLINLDKKVFKHIKNPSDKVCKYAIKKDPSFILFVNKDIDEDTLFNTVKQNTNLFKDLKNPSFSLCKRFIEEYPNYIVDVKLNKEDPNYREQMIELYKIVLNKINKRDVLYHVPDEFHTEEICLLAIERDKNNIKYIKDVNIRKSLREKFDLW